MDVTARRAARILLGAASVTLQGCDVPTHAVGHWQTLESYLETYQAAAPGQAATLNGCSLDSPRYLQCNGHGVCTSWLKDPNSDNATEVASSLKFCQCEEEWADPNCQTPRKSQQIAFLLSMFGGFLGLDQLYLGFFFPYGLLKLLTLGGAGLWWIYDLVRIGSSPVATAANFQVAENVPHWAFVLSSTAFFVALAFVYSAWSIQRHRVQKQREVMMLQAESASLESQRHFSGYGSTLG
ncbi:unnamed protein product [Effrenium voratum]|uniref:TM2 domain-containing protein n=1 Tax=Effrenium voratum TaxID=2562239 RepID=A0AA36J838_9DINO|nr:unnamed protein product [Effrenium voratum]CAJ1447320.1 unnamed protein product [Effrenium voratum]